MDDILETVRDVVEAPIVCAITEHDLYTGLWITCRAKF